MTFARSLKGYPEYASTYSLRLQQDPRCDQHEDCGEHWTSHDNSVLYVFNRRSAAKRGATHTLSSQIGVL